MNWLERARSEITKSAGHPTAVTAVRNPTAVLAVPRPAISRNSRAPVDADGIADWWQERAASMEFSVGLSREDAERLAWSRVMPADYRVH